MGAYNKGGIKLLCDIADPQIGILTGINNQHLATFGSQENIVKAKFELIEYVKDFAVLNWDNFLIQKHKIKKDNIFKSSYKEKQDIYAENIKVFKDHLEFDVIINDKRENFSINVLGKQNISNILTATITANKLGMSLKEIKEAVKKIKPEFGGMTHRKNFLDATYSSNANAVIAHLDFLKNWKGKKVIIMPCLIELGTESKRIHEEIGKKINEICDLAIITTQDQFQTIKNQAKDKVIFESDINKIIELIKKYNSKEDIILLESRVPKKIIEYSKK
jgi:UDP-N-acetylmuramoyl-tripeptide--D-alanyl-D-alanine ligase